MVKRPVPSIAPAGAINRAFGRTAPGRSSRSRFPDRNGPRPRQIPPTRTINWPKQSLRCSGASIQSLSAEALLRFISYFGASRRAGVQREGGLRGMVTGYWL